MINWQDMKGNGVGKALAFFSLSLFILIPIHADVVLHVLNDDSEEIQDVVVGQPFYLEVSINGLGRTTPPLLDGADHINARRTGYQMSSVNGDASIKYTYVATADKPGEHIVGPAHVYAKGKEYVSGIAKVAVHTDTRAIASNQRKTDPVFLRASVDKAHVVVGECVTCHLRFYYDRSMLALKSIGQHDIDGFEQKNIVGPEQGTEVVDGKRYEYAQWAWQWYPRQTGEFAVPAHYADFESRASRSDNVRQWGAFFNARRRQKRVYSNALNIKVDPLPDYPNEVAAVGNFTHVRASISPGMAKQGEGMILAFEFDGEGDLDALQVPIVRGMPEELKYYDSKTNIELNDNGLSTKRFEFVVQALKPGTFEIPQQTFTIFDTESRFYKQLETAPLLVTISPSNALDQVVFQEPQSEDTVSADTALNDAWLPLHEHGPWIARSERKPMPPFLFIFFLIVPLAISLYRRGSRYLLGLRAKRSPIFFHKKAFSIARASLQAAQKDKDITLLNQILCTLYAHRTEQDVSRVSLDDIAQKVSAHDRAAWHIFATNVAASSFGGSAMSQEQQEQLLEQAEQWITKLENVL